MLKVLIFFITLSLNANAIPPKLFISPAPIFDMECERRTNFRVEPTWIVELYKKKNSFQEAWDKYSESINRMSEDLAGRSFSRREYSVSLILCKWTPMGNPLIVSARPFLEKSAADDPSIKKPLDILSFVSLTHHELLHSLLDNIETLEFSSSSLMLRKYQKEPFNVLVHLHLMALQKAVYEKLNQAKLLEQTEILYRFIGGEYLRVWEIIQTEGTSVFTKELKAYNSKK